MEIILDNIRSASNIGSIFRSCDAFAVGQIHLCGISAVPPNKEILKTALGATETVKWTYHTSAVELIQQLRESGRYHLIAIEQAPDSVPLGQFQPGNDRIPALVLGNELEGVSAAVLDLCDHVVEIPQYGTKKSLNVAVAAGIAIWDLRQKGHKLNR